MCCSNVVAVLNRRGAGRSNGVPHWESSSTAGVAVPGVVLGGTRIDQPAVSESDILGLQRACPVNAFLVLGLLDSSTKLVSISTWRVGLSSWFISVSTLACPASVATTTNWLVRASGTTWLRRSSVDNRLYTGDSACWRCWRI